MKCTLNIVTLLQSEMMFGHCFRHMFPAQSLWFQCGYFSFETYLEQKSAALVNYLVCLFHRYKHWNVYDLACSLSV